MGRTRLPGYFWDSKGNLYGTTVDGGAFGHGTVFKLSASGQQTVLYTFRGGADGARPAAALIRDGSGNFYGTTSEGGASGNTVSAPVASSLNTVPHYVGTGTFLGVHCR